MFGIILQLNGAFYFFENGNFLRQIVTYLIPTHESNANLLTIGILLPKLLTHTVREKCSRDRGKLLKFETEGRDFANFLQSLEQFIQTMKGQNNFW